MTVRHRQRKGAKSGFFLYAREKAFSKPQLFLPKPPEDSLKVPNNPTRPASFLRQFSPQHSPVARPFRGKNGLFCPQRPPYPPLEAAQTPLFAPVRLGFRPARPGKRPGRPAFCPGSRDPRTPLGPLKHPRVRLLRPPAPASTRCAPPERPKVAPPAAETAPPCIASPPVAAARRPKVSPTPPPRHSLGAGNPDCRGRLSRFAVEKCATPRGDQIPGHDG